MDEPLSDKGFVAVMFTVLYTLLHYSISLTMFVNITAANSYVWLKCVLFSISKLNPIDLTRKQKPDIGIQNIEKCYCYRNHQ